MAWECACGVLTNSGSLCPTCTVYNATVNAVQAGAVALAKSYDKRTERAWTNEHGVFAWLDGKIIQIAPARVGRLLDGLVNRALKMRFKGDTCWTQEPPQVKRQRARKAGCK